MDARLEPALQRVEEARHVLKAAELAAEQVKLELGVIELKEREAIRRFYTAARRATPLMRALVERHGGEISFTFDSNGRSVWLVGVFDKSGPPTVRKVKEGEYPWPPMVEDSEDAEEGEPDA